MPSCRFLCADTMQVKKSVFLPSYLPSLSTDILSKPNIKNNNKRGGIFTMSFDKRLCYYSPNSSINKLNSPKNTRNHRFELQNYTTLQLPIKVISLKIGIRILSQRKEIKTWIALKFKPSTVCRHT